MEVGGDLVERDLIRLIHEVMADEEEESDEDVGAMDIADVLMMMEGEAGEHGLEKLQDFYEEVVPVLTDQQFKEQFRLTRDSVDKVVEIMEEEDESPVPKEKKVLLSLWYLGSAVSFRKVAMVFGMSLGAAWKCVDQVIQALVAGRGRFIRFPEKEQLEQVIQRFQIRGFPGVIGAVDGCHIPITRPNEDEFAYVNRKHIHSINLMAVVDDAGVFIDVCVGWPGSVHDSRVFKNSPLGLRLKSEQFRRAALPDDSHIIGDAAFQLSEYMMTPFRENQVRAEAGGQPTPAQKKFYNKKLSSVRVVVEHAFGVLKGRFRRLSYVETKSVEKAVSIVTAACVLHNICCRNEDAWLEAGEPGDLPVPDDGDNLGDAGDGRAGVEKRFRLVEQLWAERR